MQVLDATRDVTEKDLAMLRYRKLQEEQLVWKAKKQVKKRKLIFGIW